MRIKFKQLQDPGIQGSAIAVLRERAVDRLLLMGVEVDIVQC